MMAALKLGAILMYETIANHGGEARGMDESWIAVAQKTRAVFACLVCGYIGPLAYRNDRQAVCQRCQCGALSYLMPRCPTCGVYVGIQAARAGAETHSYFCSACGDAWQERYAASGGT